MRTRLLLPRLMAVLTLSTLLPVATIAQDTANTASTAPSTAVHGEEHVNLLVGDIVEILPSTDIAKPSYSWILTQERTFIQSARSAVFRIRLVQPGTYTLLAEIDAADGSSRINRTFVIHAKARTPGDIAGSNATAGSGSTGIIVSTDPAIDANERSVLQPGQELLRLTPQNQDNKPLSLDLDTTRDSDGNGNPSDDVDNRDTFFQAYATPLYVWFASPITGRKLSVTTIGASGEALVQQIEADSAQYALAQGFLKSPITMTAVTGSGGTVSFTVAFVSDLPGAPPLLYHWDFGDDTESLLMNPTHTYSGVGTYAVKLTVKNLLLGKDIASAEQSIVVAEVPSTASSAASAASSAMSSPPANTGGGGFSIMSMVWLFVVFLVFVAIGGLIVWIASKVLKGRSLEKTFEQMEKHIVEKDGDKKAPPPLTIPSVTAPMSPAATTAKPAQTVVPPAAPQIMPTERSKPQQPAPTKDAFVKREENAASSPKTAETPRINEAAAPAWLKKGLANPPPSQPAPVPPVPPAAKTSPLPASPSLPKEATAPVPPPITPKAPAPQAPSGPVPAWLQNAPSAAMARPTPLPTVAPAVPSPASPARSTQPETMKQRPAPTPPSAPVEKQANILPSPSTSPDPPIAIIRAESLEDERKKEGGQQS